VPVEGRLHTTPVIARNNGYLHPLPIFIALTALDCRAFSVTHCHSNSSRRRKYEQRHPQPRVRPQWHQSHQAISSKVPFLTVRHWMTSTALSALTTTKTAAATSRPESQPRLHDTSPLPFPSPRCSRCLLSESLPNQSSYSS
jgi:hypothetical protein